MALNFDRELATLRVLVIDDMNTMRMMLAGCLKEMGFEHVSSEMDGERGWQYLSRNRVDIIICDWDMPKLNGLELLQRVRKDENLSHIPFLMVTAGAEVDRVKQALADGVTDYLVKPFQAKDLCYRVLKVLRKIQAKSAC